MMSIIERRRKFFNRSLQYQQATFMFVLKYSYTKVRLEMRNYTNITGISF